MFYYSLLLEVKLPVESGNNVNATRSEPAVVMSDAPTDSGSSSVRSFLADHPRMTGVLFTMLLLLVQAGQVAAGGGAYSGP